MSERNKIINKNNILQKIRSKYIIIKIFDYLKENKLLNIINYNKKHQKLMNVKLKDYKNEFLKIELEIIPKKNTYGRFINFIYKNSAENIHIYFNDNNKEIERNEITEDDKVTKIKVIIDHKLKSFLGLFFFL